MLASSVLFIVMDVCSCGCSRGGRSNCVYAMYVVYVHDLYCSSSVLIRPSGARGGLLLDLTPLLPYYVVRTYMLYLLWQLFEYTHTRGGQQTLNGDVSPHTSPTGILPSRMSSPSDFDL